MKLSIIIPTYNVGSLVSACIKSCLQQDISSSAYEIIVVNDGSTDESLSIAEQTIKGHNNVRIYSQPNGGLSAARNQGTLMAQGDYVWYVDADDTIAPNCLGHLLQLCQENQLDMLTFCAANRKGDGSLERRFHQYDKGCLPGVDFMDNGYIMPCAPFAIYRREWLRVHKLEFVPKLLHEDSDFKPRAYYLAQRVQAIDDICYYVTCRDGSITHKFNRKRVDDILLICGRMETFANTEVNPSSRIIFYNYIALLFNDALFNASLLEGSRNEMDQCLYSSRTYLRYLKLSNLQKFKVEYFLLHLHIHRMCSFYSFFNRLPNN